MNPYLRTGVLVFGFLCALHITFLQSWEYHTGVGVICAVVNAVAALLSTDEWPSAYSGGEIRALPDEDGVRRTYFHDRGVIVAIVEEHEDPNGTD